MNMRQGNDIRKSRCNGIWTGRKEGGRRGWGKEEGIGNKGSQRITPLNIQTLKWGKGERKGDQTSVLPIVGNRRKGKRLYVLFGELYPHVATNTVGMKT